MDKKLKEKWIADLRTHRQTKKFLCSKNGRSHCCLGRLALVMGYKFAVDTMFPYCQSLVIDGKMTTERAFLPRDVTAKAGLDDNALDTLVGINDNSHGFKKVIKYIEENL